MLDYERMKERTWENRDRSATEGLGQARMRSKPGPESNTATGRDMSGTGPHPAADRTGAGFDTAAPVFQSRRAF